MKRLLPYSLLAAILLAVFGMRAGWFHQGFSDPQLAQLERDWAELVGWAELPELGPDPDRPLTELALEWRAAETVESVPERDGEAEHGSLPRAQLPQATAVFLERFETLLAEGRADVPVDPEVTIAVLELGQLALRTDDLDAERVARVLGLTRRMQRDGQLIMFMVGTALAGEALDRCQENPALVPTSVAAPAPERDELFGALCRDYVALHRLQIEGALTGDPEDPFEGFPAAGEFLVHSSQAAMVNIARRYRPLMGEPERFDEVAVPEPVGKFATWRAATFRRPEAMAEVMETLLQPQLQTRGLRWAEFVDEWNEVLGG